MRIAVTFDADVARRTLLHDAKHPVRPGDAYFASLVDAGPVAEALRAQGHRVTTVGLTRGDAVARLSRLKAELVFNLCDTLGAESRLAPLVPALLETRGLPFVGADQFGLALSKRKHDVKAVLVREGLPTPRYGVVASAAEVKALTLDGLELPVILKLTAEHSSIGLDATSVCFTLPEVRRRALALLRRYGQPVLLEEYVGGREFYVSLCGARALPMMEHRFDGLPDGHLPIRTFDVKWFDDATKSRPRRVDPRWRAPVPLRQPATPWRGTLRDVPAICRRAFEVVGGRDWGRVDLRLDKGGVPMLIDVTPNTYLGPSAPCVKAAEQAGLSYPRFVGAIAAAARSRAS